MPTFHTRAKREMAETFAVSVIANNRAVIREAIHRFYKKRGRVTAKDVMNYLMFTISYEGETRDYTLEEVLHILTGPLGGPGAAPLRRKMVWEIEAMIEQELSLMKAI